MHYTDIEHLKQHHHSSVRRFDRSKSGSKTAEMYQHMRIDKGSFKSLTIAHPNERRMRCAWKIGLKVGP